MTTQDQFISGQDEEILLPEGWGEDGDIFALTDEDQSDFFQGEDAGLPQLDAAPEAEAVPEEEAASAVTAEEAPEEVSEDAVAQPSEAPEQTEGQTIRVRYNHETLDMPVAVAAQYAQKGLNYDRMMERLGNTSLELAQTKQQLQQMAWAEQAQILAKRMGYESAAEMVETAQQNFLQAQVDQLVDTGVPEPLAKEMVESKLQSQAQPPQQSMPVQPITPPPNLPPPMADPVITRAEQEVDVLLAAFPEAGKALLPDSVLDAFNAGVPLVAAYARYKEQEAQKQLTIAKQNQDSAFRAPVTGATKHGSGANKAKDPFLAGFDSDAW